MHNIIGDVALTSISVESNYFQDFSECPKQKFSVTFPQPLGYVLSMFLSIGHFSALRS